jgi:hypothetical protein
VNELEVILQDVCYRIISDTDLSIDISPVIDHYNRWKLSSIGSVGSMTPTRSVMGSFSPFSSSKSPSLPLPMQTPAYVFDILGTIQEHHGWSSLESSSQPWAVFSAASPHILVYSTSAWNYLFGLHNEQDNLTVRSFRDFTMNIPSPRLMQRPASVLTPATSSKKAQDQYLHRDSEGSTHSVNERLLESALRYGNQQGTASSIASSLYNSLSFSRTNDSRASQMTGGASYHIVNDLINHTYYQSATNFMNQLQDYSEGHGVVPMTRKLGRTMDSFQCSVHAYGIYPKRLDYQEDAIKTDVRPVYFAILFNELKHHSSQADTPSDSHHSVPAIVPSASGNTVKYEPIVYDMDGSFEQKDWPDLEAKSKSSSFGSIFSMISQSSFTERASFASVESFNLLKYASSSKKNTALLNPRDLEAEEESWVE